MEVFSKKLASSGFSSSALFLFLHPDLTIHVDGSIRDKAFKNLQRWLTEQHGNLKEQDYLLLWKALFYCMWMADKPSYQERLAGRLADVGGDLYTISPAAGLQYMKAFWETLCREWPGLDRYRLDKFYLLLGAGYRATMSLHKLGASLERVQEILLQWPLNPTSVTIPDSVRIYSLEHFEEALRTADYEPKEATMLVIKVLIPMAAKVKKSPVLRAAAILFNQMAKTENHLDWDQVSAAAFAAGEEAAVASPNRVILYKIRK